MIFVKLFVIKAVCKVSFRFLVRNRRILDSQQGNDRVERIAEVLEQSDSYSSKLERLPRK